MDVRADGTVDEGTESDTPDAEDEEEAAVVFQLRSPAEGDVDVAADDDDNDVDDDADAGAAAGAEVTTAEGRVDEGGVDDAAGAIDVRLLICDGSSRDPDAADDGDRAPDAVAEALAVPAAVAARDVAGDEACAGALARGRPGDPAPGTSNVEDDGAAAAAAVAAEATTGSAAAAAAMASPVPEGRGDAPNE